MHTIKLQIQDDIYDSLVSKGVDINRKLQEFITTLADDGYPSISTQEAKKRVSDAVQRYRDGSGTYTPFDKDYMNEMHNYIQSL
jgi:polyhydroxyalkanoate synthesis regulator phasin